MFEKLIKSEFVAWVLGLFSDSFVIPQGEGPTLFIYPYSEKLWSVFLGDLEGIVSPGGTKKPKHNFYHLSFGSTGVYMYHKHRKPRIQIVSDSQDPMLHSFQSHEIIVLPSSLYNQLMLVRPAYVTILRK